MFLLGLLVGLVIGPVLVYLAMWAVVWHFNAIDRRRFGVDAQILDSRDSTSSK